MINGITITAIAFVQIAFGVILMRLMARLRAVTDAVNGILGTSLEAGVNSGSLGEVGSLRVGEPLPGSLLVEAAHDTKWSLWVLLSKNDAGTPAILSELQPGRLGGDFEFKLVFVDSMPDDLADRLRPFASLRPSLGTVGDTPLVLITGPGGEVQGTGSISAAEDVVAFVEEGRRRGIIASTPR